MNKRGYLFTFEGGEGAGKGTQIDLLRKRLLHEGFKVSNLKYYEPGGTDFADTIRAILKKRLDTSYAQTHLKPIEGEIDKFDIDPLSQAFLFLAARAHQVKTKVKKDISEGNIILLDRNIDSTAVYQGHAQNPELLELIRIANNTILSSSDVKIDKTFFLDIPIDVAKARVNVRQGDAKDFFDKKPDSFYYKLREGYLSEWQHTHNLPKEHPHHQRIEKIDATGKIEDIHEELYRKVKEIMKNS